MDLGNVPLKTEYYTSEQNTELIGMIKAAIWILSMEESIESQHPNLPNFAYKSPKAGGPPLFSYSKNGVNDIAFSRKYGKEAWETASALTGAGKSSKISRVVPKIDKDDFDSLSLNFIGIDDEARIIQGIKTFGLRFNYTSPKTGKHVNMVFYEPAYLYEKGSTYPTHFFSADFNAE